MELITFVGWQVLLLLALTGYGWVARRIMHLDGFNNTIGIEIILGMAVIAVLGGVVTHTGLANPTVWTCLLVLGVVPLFVRLLLEAASYRLPTWGSASSTAVMAIIAIAVATNTTLTREWSKFDDEPAYLYLSRRLWQLGNLSDEYNARRLSSHGLQSMFQALASGPIGAVALNAFDEVVGCLLLVSAICAVKRLRDRWWMFTLAIALAAFHGLHGSANSSPNLIFMAVYVVIVTEVFVRWDDAAARRNLLVVQVIAIATLTMMRPYGAAVLAVFVIWQLITLERPRLSWLTPRTIVCVFAILTPWMALEWRDSGTPFFPVIKGVASREFPIAGYSERVALVPFLGRSMWDLLSSGAVPWLAFSVAMNWLILSSTRSGRRITMARLSFLVVATTCIVYTLAFAVTVRRSGTPLYWAHYWSPFLIGVGVAPAFVAFFHTVQSARRRLVVLAAQVLLIGGGYGVLPHVLFERVASDVVDLVDGDANSNLATDRFADKRADYVSIADTIPDGRRLLSAVQFPHLLLDRGFEIQTVDFGVATAPHGEFPSIGNYEEQVAWLRSQGFDYLLVHTRDTDSTLYGQSTWRDFLAESRASADMAYYVLRWLDFTYLLTDKVTPVATSGDLVLIDLADLR